MSKRKQIENMQTISSETTDEDLVTLYNDGNEQAFQILVKRHLDGLFNFCMKYTFDTEAAEDIVQDSFVKAWKNLSKFDNKNSFKTWLYTIGKNTALDYLRKNKNLPFSVLQGIEDMVLEPALINSSSMGATQHMNAHYLDMKDGLNTLPGKDKSIIEMHYQQGYAFREIAEKLGRSTDTVKTWHRRAMAKLRDILE